VLLLALALAPLLLPEVVHAEEYTSSRKFGRGLAGMTVGFLEIPGNVVEQSRNNGALYGMTLGLAMGLGKCVTRELVGVFEFLTAPFEMPKGFKPILEPEFPWQYFETEAAGP
jgi:putative exosortase-associated protein (TIGR04073 family)